MSDGVSVKLVSEGLLSANWCFKVECPDICEDDEFDGADGMSIVIVFSE